MPVAPGETPAPAELHEGTEHPAGEHEAGGLPQFDFAWWPGQILWFLIIFAIVLVFMKVFAAPKVGGTIEAREDHINGQIADARRMKEEADAKAEAAAVEVAQARANAQKVASDARAKAGAEAAARLAEEEAKLAQTSAQAEARIAKAREQAMTNVQSIAADAANAIVAKLTGKAASAAELSKAGGQA
jgi:F-type H+-transporting ATPase subunit b